MIDYNIRYTVAAFTKLEAIANATAMLRTGVKLRGVIHAVWIGGQSWDVVLSVSEDV